MKVLLTGGAGFLGSHISNKLIENDHQVTVLDDLSTGNLKNIKHLESNPNFKFIKHDVRNPYRDEVDAILNFACPASPTAYQQDPVRTIETNFLGMINVLHLAKDTGAMVIQASTSEVYGDPIVSPQKEEYWGNVNPIGIRSCYDEGKRAAEALCFDYKRQHGADVRVIRIFNTYGPNMSKQDGRVVSNFIVQALSNEPITIYGDGSQSRSFCYVSDLVHAVDKILNLKQSIDTPINLGNPNEFTMLELAEAVIKLTGSNSRLIFKPLPGDDPKQRRPDISRAFNLIGWQPRIQIRDGLEKTIDYFKSTI